MARWISLPPLWMLHIVLYGEARFVPMYSMQPSDIPHCGNCHAQNQDSSGQMVLGYIFAEYRQAGVFCLGLGAKTQYWLIRIESTSVHFQGELKGIYRVGVLEPTPECSHSPGAALAGPGKDRMARHVKGAKWRKRTLDRLRHTVTRAIAMRRLGESFLW